MNEYQKIERAYFYNSSRRDILADISWLIEKLYTKNNSILVYCSDQETVRVVDDFLWAYKEDGFIPHSIKNDQNSACPVLIKTSIDEDTEHNILVALNGILLKEKELQKFIKVYYFFDNQNSKQKENAGSLWKQVTSQDIDCKYWVNKKNKWVLEHSN